MLGTSEGDWTVATLLRASPSWQERLRSAAVSRFARVSCATQRARMGGPPTVPLTGWGCSSTGRARPCGPGPSAAPGSVRLEVRKQGVVIGVIVANQGEFLFYKGADLTLGSQPVPRDTDLEKLKTTVQKLF